MKGHSYLQRFPLFIVPGTLWKKHKDLTFKLIQRMAEQFYDLFHTGFTIEDQQWHAACIGSKGDLNWFSAICNLTRGYEMKSTNRNVPCCHYCMAGGPGLPAEDITSQPAWLGRCFSSGHGAWSNLQRRMPSLLIVPNRRVFIVMTSLTLFVYRCI